MTLEFKFSDENRWRTVDMPPNILMAYKDTRATQIKKVVSGIVLSILFIAVMVLITLAGSTMMRNQIFPLCFLGFIGVFIFTIRAMIDRSLISLMIYNCIMTVGFDEFLTQRESHLSRGIASRSVIITSTMLEERKAEKLLMTVKNLSSLLEEVEMATDLNEVVDITIPYVSNIGEFQVRKAKARRTYVELSQTKRGK